MTWVFRPMDEATAHAVLEWRYEPPYDLYNVAPGQRDEATAVLLDPANAYYSLHDPSGDLAAFCCFGADAQVPGGDYIAEALDIGAGLRPDLTGQGHGSALIGAILDFAREQYHPATCRVTIAAFNQRAQRAWQRASFCPAQSFARESDGRAFVVLVRREGHCARARRPSPRTQYDEQRVYWQRCSPRKGRARVKNAKHL